MFAVRFVARIAMAAALGSTPALAQQTARSFTTPTELRELGRQILAESVTESGRDPDPVWRRDVGMVIDSVQRAAAYRAHPVAWELVGDSSMNASAGPGGVMIVNVGLPIFCTEVAAAKAGGDAGRARRSYLGCLAAVIGHEFGHLALGHSDSVASTRARRGEIRERKEQASGIAAFVRDSILMRGLRLERGQELAADAAGALYILRAGWEVQDMIDLFTAMDSVARRRGGWRGDLTWLRGHPRGSERAALLEGQRAQLKLNQRDFDDALALVDHNVMPDSALGMLDRVLRDLPFIPAARHARAVLLARKWLATASAADLRVRPTLPAYDAQFMTSIKGGNALLLRDARVAFGEALAGPSAAHPYTLANLAMLDAYAGDTATALQRARLAATRMPDDADVQNNLGVVLYLAGRMAEARTAFARAEALATDGVTPTIAFNVARATFAAGDSAAARRLLARYLAFDQSSAWGREALAMQRQLDGQVATVSRPATISTPAATTTPVNAERAPLVAGVRLGTPASQVLRLLGRPDLRDSREDGVVWKYGAKGVQLIIHPVRGVLVIALVSRAAGDVSGVRVGDALAPALRLLGPVSEVNEEIHAFDRGAWRLTLRARDGVVEAIALEAKG